MKLGEGGSCFGVIFLGVCGGRVGCGVAFSSLVDSDFLVFFIADVYVLKALFACGR